MSVGTTDLMARISSSSAFTNAVGNEKHGEDETIVEFLSFDGNGNSVEVKDSDNETFKLSLSDLAKELGMSVEDLKAQIDETGATDGVEAADTTEEAGATTEVGKTESAKKSDEIQKEIDGLNADREASMGELEALEGAIRELTDTIKDKLEEAAKKQEAKLEAHQEEVEKLIEDQVEAYKKAAETDKPMSKDDLKANINAGIRAIDGISAGADVVTDLFMIAGDLTTLDNKLAQVKGLTDKVADIDNQLDAKAVELETAKAAEAAAAQAASSSSDGCCPRPDPIGFQMETEAGEAMQVDFFVDRDGDGTVTDASEFLGAVTDAKGGDGWAEMQALNTDGNGVVDTDELKDTDAQKEKLGGELKVMVTIGDEQKAMSIAEFEETYGALELNADKDAETNTAVGPKDFADEKYENEQLGSFGLTVGGQKLSGYQTKDDMNYLNDHYEFSSGAAEGADGNALAVAAGLEIGETDAADAVDGAEEVEVAEDLQHYVEFYADYAQKAQELREQLEAEWQRHGLNEDFITTINKSAAIIAEGKVSDVETKDKADEAGEADEADNAETEPVDEAQGADNEGAEDDKEKEKEPEEAAV